MAHMVAHIENNPKFAYSQVLVIQNSQLTVEARQCVYPKRQEEGSVT